MEGMMVMGLRAGREAVGIKGSTSKGYAMDMACTSSILEIHTQENGGMDRAMELEFRPAVMAAVTLENSSME